MAMPRITKGVYCHFFWIQAYSSFAMIKIEGKMKPRNRDDTA